MNMKLTTAERNTLLELAHLLNEGLGDIAVAPEWRYSPSGAREPSDSANMAYWSESKLPAEYDLTPQPSCEDVIMREMSGTRHFHDAIVGAMMKDGLSGYGLVN
jgi:hypothetical protein